VHTRIIHALHTNWTALGSRCRHNRDVSSNSFAGDILVIPGSIALCRGPRRFVAGATRFTSLRVVQPMHSPLIRAHPSPPSVPAHVPPPLCAGFRHCVGYHTRRRSPPAGPSTDRGRGSNPRGGTTAWSHPRRREVPHGLTEGGLLPRAPAGGIATPPRPSRPASHIHNHLSASPARVCLPPVVTTSHSALLARW
jgi:hypothetical protein